jgi:hypothetical protein
VSWRSSTSGDADGVVLDLADVTAGATLQFSAGGVAESFAIGAMGAGAEREIADGVERRIALDWLPEAPLDPDVKVTLRNPDGESAAGRHAYFVKVRQSDGNLAWSSPMFLNYA